MVQHADLTHTSIPGAAVVQDDGSTVGTASVLNFTNGTATFSNGTATVNLASGGGIAGLIVQDEGSTVGTATVLNVTGGGATATFSNGTATISHPLPGWASDQVGTTSATEFYWDGNDLASFTELDVTGTTTWAEGRNLASVLVAGTSADDVNVLLIAKTINTGDAWKVCVKGLMGHTDTGNSSFAGIIMTDGVLSSSNAIAGHLQTNEAANVYSQLLVGRSGTLTAMTTAPWVLDDDMSWPSSELWIKLTYVSANTFRVAFSPDDVTYHSFGEADIAKTMTPTHVGLMVSCNEADGAIVTFGPLKKV